MLVSYRGRGLVLQCAQTLRSFYTSTFHPLRDKAGPKENISTTVTDIAASAASKCIWADVDAGITLGSIYADPLPGLKEALHSDKLAVLLLTGLLAIALLIVPPPLLRRSRMGPLRTLPGWAWNPFAEAGFFFLVRLLALLIVLLRAALLAPTFSALLVLLLTLIGHHVLLEIRSMVTLPFAESS
jgi:hypothetical protein